MKRNHKHTDMIKRWLDEDPSIAEFQRHQEAKAALRKDIEELAADAEKYRKFAGHKEYDNWYAIREKHLDAQLKESI